MEAVKWYDSVIGSKHWSDQYTRTGTTIAMATCINLMDDEIREILDVAGGWVDGIDGERAFLEAYCGRHLAKFGTEFEVN